MVKKRGLGKSLDALLAYASGNDTAETEQEKFCQLPMDRIERGKYQPRREMDKESLEELANSIRSHGVIQAIVVRPIGNHYEIIAGERRFRAAKIAGLEEIPAMVRSIPDEAAIAIALIENIQRENLNPIEEAIALQRLIEEFGMTHQEVAEAIGKSRASVTNLLRLLALPDEVKNLLERRRLEMGHARTLITLPEKFQLEAAEIIVNKELSVRAAENLARQLQLSPFKKSKKSTDPNIQHLQENLSRQFNLPVALHCNAKGKGRLVIHYRNLTELDKLLAHLEVT